MNSAQRRKAKRLYKRTHYFAADMVVRETDRSVFDPNARVVFHVPLEQITPAMLQDAAMSLRRKS